MNKILNLNLLIILVIAILLRALWALLIPVIPISDSHAYDVFAQNIWLHGTYGWEVDKPTSYWPVGTSAIYSLFYMIFGHNYLPIVIFNIICTLVIIYYSKKLCDSHFDKPGVGIYVAIILATWPTLIFYTTVLASELPYTAAILVSIYCFTKNNQNTVRDSIIAGVLFAVAYYIRPLASITLAICIFYLFLHEKKLKVVAGRTFLCVITLVLLVIPWAYRNYLLYGHLVTMSTNGGATFWMGNQPGTRGGYLEIPEKYYVYDEYTRNKVLKEEGIRYIKEEPVLFLTRTVEKFIIFHARETIGVTWNKNGIQKIFGEKSLMPLKVVSQLYWSVVLILSLLGLSMFIKNRGLMQLCVHPFFLIWISTACIHALIVAQDRYHIPMIPMIVSFAGYCLADITRKQTKD